LTTILKKTQGNSGGSSGALSSSSGNVGSVGSPVLGDDSNEFSKKVQSKRK